MASAPADHTSRVATRSAGRVLASRAHRVTRWLARISGNLVWRRALPGFLVLAGAGMLMYLLAIAPAARAGGSAREQFAVSVRVVAACSIAIRSSIRVIRTESPLVRVACRGHRPYSVSYARGEVVAAGLRSMPADARYAQSSGLVAAAGPSPRVMIVTVNF